ncbi:MAG: hypothetical protein B6I36_05190 [Desulfobacteraceae bacterium 4572_35.1]|nr:MAG: hypothetical protein B6I36_05190 [Desulfobacteraceae bacterium 4572_35.1]
MCDREVLKTLFNSSLLGVVGTKSGRNFVKLKESDSGAKLKNVDIFDVATDSVLVNLDRSDPSSSLFVKSEGKRKRCDYLLITEVNDEKYIFFIELKSGKISRYIGQQFKGAECIVDYCDSTLSRFHEIDAFFKGYKKRFICFYKPLISKKPTRLFKPNPLHSRPENMWKYPSPHNPSIKQLI